MGKQISKLLRTGVNKSLDSCGTTALHKAVETNDLALVQQLLSLEANVNAQGSLDQTPLHYAAFYNKNDSHYEVAETLLKNGADVRAREYDGQTPLHFLVTKGSVRIVKLFLKYKADVSELNDCQESLLCYATSHRNENLEVLQLLVDLGLDANSRCGFGKTALYHAVGHNGPLQVQKLISSGSDVNAECFKDKRTPLHEAAWHTQGHSHLEVVEILLKSGADIDARDSEGKTPLHHWAQHGDIEIVRLFSNFGPRVDLLDDSEENVVFPAVRSNKNVEMVQFLLDLGLEVNHRNHKGRTLLHASLCLDSEYVKTIKCLLKNGANVNEVDLEGHTPLTYMLLIFCMNRWGGSSEHEKGAINFMLEHSDLSVVHNGINILTLYEEPHEEYMWKLILEHVAKLEAVNVPVHQDILDAISEVKEYSEYYEQCKEELSRAKSSKLKNSWVSFYNLLVDGRRRLKNYAGNEDLIKDFEKSDCVRKFPVYGEVVDKNVKTGVKRRELFDKSCVLLSECLPVFNPSHLVIRDTLDCVLSKKDLSKFCENN